MDHERIVVSADEDNDLEEVAGTVRADEQPSVWFLSGVFGRERMINRVEDVLVGDAVLAGRLVDLRMIIVLRIGATGTRRRTPRPQTNLGGGTTTTTSVA